MVARLVWDQDAAGSNPVPSTTRLSLDAIRVPGSAFCFAFSLVFMAGTFFTVKIHNV